MSDVADQSAHKLAHESVLLDESLKALNIRPDGVYVDATFGRGGHSQAILQQLGEGGRLIGFDQDQEAIAYGKEKFADEPRLILEYSNFDQMKDVIAGHGLLGKVDGVLMDLGVSSPQLDDANRGFSFMRSGPLDMRMDTGSGESAKQWLSYVGLEDLKDVLKWYGEEKFARRIATAIVEARSEADIETTGELAQIVSDAIPVKDKFKHPATRSFQAIRIFINRELKVLETGLDASLEILNIKGRLAVISFHSLEDRIVKRFMRDKSSRPPLPRGLPIMEAEIEVPFKRVGKPVVASEGELKGNARSRSARLRVLERVLIEGVAP